MEHQNNPQQEKEELRRLLKIRRAEISEIRRREASTNLLKDMLPQLERYPYVLSYASFGDELDTWMLNRELESQGRLLLSRVAEQQLELYAVTDLDAQLHCSPWNILEPDPKQCVPIALDHASVVLVPGLGFDNSRHRIGYGKGHYDRILAQMEAVPAFGIGFQEQVVAEGIPTAPHDIQLTDIFLY